MKRSIVLLVTALAAGCAGAPAERASESLFADASFPVPAERVSPDDVFALSEPMRAYLASKILTQVDRKGLRAALLDAVRDDLRIEYESTLTRTAAQTFEARSGNCLSLVVMTGALAQELGIPVVYQSVYGHDTWTRHQGVVFHSNHVNLALGSQRPAIWGRTDLDTPLIVDFLPAAAAAHVRARPIPRELIAAMFMNNRAAEIMAAGDVGRAYWWARAAIKTFPAYVSAYNTLGVLYARHGELPHAERALRHALALEPENVEVLTNLGSLLERQGRVAEAGSLRERLARAVPVPPFQFLDKGLAALSRGEAEAALRLFRKELARRPYDDEVHFAMAVAGLRLGDVRLAQRHLTLARDHSTTRDQQGIYAAKLEHLKALR